MDESSAANESRAELVPAPLRTHIADRYRVLRVLGEGSSGIVYLCEHTALAKEVAVKVLHRELADNSGLVARFTREAQTAARLDHPNSVHVMDFGQDRDGMLYLVMEYVDGPDLAQLLAENLPLDEDRIVHFMSCILSALSAAHALGIVHRDLKPENVLVRLAEPESTAPDVVKVCDFGVAQFSPVRLARDSASGPISTQTRRVTGEGMMVGTPWYMSPEQARAEALDERSDIYSAGVVLFQLLTRTLPFMGDDVMAVALMHCTTPPPPPSGYCAVHPGLEAVCLTALSKTPEARYQSATEMLSALRKAVATKVESRSLARTSRTSLTKLPKLTPVPGSERPEHANATPMASPSVRPSSLRNRVKPSLLVAGVATTLLGVAAVPRFLPSQHEVVTTLSAAASRSASIFDNTAKASEGPQLIAADVNIQNELELSQPLASELSSPSMLPLAAAEPDQPTPATAAIVTPVAPAAMVTPAALPRSHNETRKIQSVRPALPPTAATPATPSAPAIESTETTAPAPSPSKLSALDPESDSVPESPSQAAASAADIALATLPAAAPTPASVTPAASPKAAEVPQPPAKPHVPVKFARVDVAAEHLPPGTTRASLRSALNQVALLGCYTQAQQRTPTAELTGTALQLKTNTSGRIVWAHAANGALPAALRECLEQVTRSGYVRTGEGGEVQAKVELLPSP